MTYESKIDEIEKYLEDCYVTFNINIVRQTIEAICKLIILKEYGEVEGTKIIRNKSEASIRGYNLENAINSIIFHENNSKQLINDMRVRNYLSFIHGHTNIGSHNDDNSKLNEYDKLLIFINLNKLIEWIFNEYLEQTINEELTTKIKNVYKSFELLNIKDNNIELEWNNLVTETNGFNKNLNKYFLITDEVKNSNFIESLFNIKWNYIADFDNKSKSTGLHSLVKEFLNNKRNINLLTTENELDYSKSTLFWDFVNGMYDIPTTLTKNYRVWNQRSVMTGNLQKHIEQIHKNIEQSNIYIFIFWENLDKRYLVDFISILQNYFPDLNIILSSSSNQLLTQIQEQIDEFDTINETKYFNLSIERFSILLSNYNKLQVEENIHIPSLVPGQDIVYHIVEKNEYIKYEDDVKIIPPLLNIEPKSCNDYYKGSSINFSYLDSDCLILRTNYTNAITSIGNILESKINKIYYLISETGSGSTSFGYKILWDFRNNYPSIHLKNYRKKNTFIFLQYLYTLTKTPLLIFIDSNLNEDNHKSLMKELDIQQIKYVLVKVVRFINHNDIRSFSSMHKHNSITILEKLKSGESKLFFNKLVQFNFQQKQQITEVLNNPEPSLFKYLFSAFLDEYKNIDKYIADKVNSLTKYQKDRLQHLCLVQYFTGENVSIYFLTKKNEKLSLFNKNSQINPLIQYNENYEIRTIHSIIAKKILVLLTGLTDENLLKQKIRTLSLEFINYIEKEFNNEKNNKNILELINNLFIRRKIRSYDTDSTTYNNNRYYTDLLENISTNDREIIFQLLIDLYSDNSHFLAHFGRFYSIDRKNIDKGLEYIDKAIHYSEKNNPEGRHDSILYHMKGMIYFREIEHLRELGKLVLDDIIVIAKEAYKNLMLALEYNTQVSNDFSSINSARLLLLLLKEGKHKHGSISSFLDAYKNDSFIFNSMETLESIISTYKEQNQEDEDANIDIMQINKIESQLLELYDNFSDAISSLYNYLATDNYNNHVLRRNIIRLTIKKSNNNVNDIDMKKVNNFMNFLEINLNDVDSESLHESDLLLFLQLIRHKEVNYNLLKLLGILADLKDNYTEERISKYNKFFRLQIVFYMYICKMLQLINGSKDVIFEINDLKEELTLLSMGGYRDKRLSREWLSSNSLDFKSIIHRYDSKLKWDKNSLFFTESSYKHLYKCKGTIKKIYGQNKGYISLNGVDIFFVPRAKFTNNDLNKTVEFYLSFGFDEPRAWNVEFK